MFISDGGSDSSVSNGPPVYLAAADVKSSKKKVGKAFISSVTIDSIQNYKIVIATLFRHFEWGKYQNFLLRSVEIQ